jgi:septal ring factor EnvC (AmiA/AmiB activator)
LTWRAITDLQYEVASMRPVLRDIVQRLKEIKSIMAADRELLAQLAADLTALAVPVQDLIESEAALRARVAELEGQAAADEAGDLEAAQSVKTAFDALAGKFTAEPESPDVEPLPEPPAPQVNPDGSADTVNPTPGSE